MKDVFTSDKVKEELSNFKNIQNGGTLTTFYKDTQVCTVEVSDIYYNFDFSGFCKNILDEIVKYFVPEKFSISCKDGVQEIRLVGGQIFIDMEEYKKMISIINSTDKTRALCMSVGLQKVSNNSCTIMTYFSNKHYKSSLPDKIKEFTENLKNFNMDIDFHVKTIEDLKNKNVSIKDFLKNIMFKEDKLMKSVELKMRALGKTLVFSYGQRAHYSLLMNIEQNRYNKYEDFVISAKTLYDAYAEVFNTDDTSVISRETRRIIEALDKCEDQRH